KVTAQPSSPREETLPALRWKPPLDRTGRLTVRARGRSIQGKEGPRMGGGSIRFPAAAMAGALAAMLPAQPARAAPSTTPQVVQTRSALDSLGSAAVSWQNNFGCSGCHKQAMTIASISLARMRGHDDAKPGVLSTILNGMLTLNSGQQADGCFTLINNGA